jgi:hypothetical protein
VQAFGRDVASRTLAGVLAGVALAVLGATWAGIRYVAPSLAASVLVSDREAVAWALVAALSLAIIVESVYIATLRRRKPSFLTTTLNGSAKPSMTLIHHGESTTYRVDGRIVRLMDGTANPQPAPFRCELQVAGIKGEWEALLKDGDWANIIFGSLEPIYPPNPSGVLAPADSWKPAGYALVVRRGKIGQHVRVPDSGAVVQLDVKTAPPLSEPQRAKQFQITRNGNTVDVTEINVAVVGRPRSSE